MQLKLTVLAPWMRQAEITMEKMEAMSKTTPIMIEMIEMACWNMSCGSVWGLVLDHSEPNCFSSSAIRSFNT